ncbi:hypothetical protein [Actinomadura rupiterrae]|nr:hypothetical protein [Actinomadura rupiterrae]MCP2343173.1 hypothetical protein [Actinomadura rupiterrae]
MARTLNDEDIRVVGGCPAEVMYGDPTYDDEISSIDEIFDDWDR